MYFDRIRFGIANVKNMYVSAQVIQSKRNEGGEREKERKSQIHIVYDRLQDYVKRNAYSNV